MTGSPAPPPRRRSRASGATPPSSPSGSWRTRRVLLDAFRVLRSRRRRSSSRGRCRRSACRTCPAQCANQTAERPPRCGPIWAPRAATPPSARRPGSAVGRHSPRRIVRAVRRRSFGVCLGPERSGPTWRERASTRPADPPTPCRFSRPEPWAGARRARARGIAGSSRRCCPRVVLARASGALSSPPKTSGPTREAPTERYPPRGTA